MDFLGFNFDCDIFDGICVFSYDWVIKVVINFNKCWWMGFYFNVDVMYCGGGVFSSDFFFGFIVYFLWDNGDGINVFIVLCVWV